MAIDDKPDRLAANGYDHQSTEYQRRLLVNIVDDYAATEPNRKWAQKPRSSKPEDGWAPITYAQLANAINHVAYIISERVAKTSTDEFPTVAYVGPSDARYAILFLAAIKAGCKALLVSPRNSFEAQQSLFDKTNCNHLWYAESYKTMAHSWIGNRPMKTFSVPPDEEWLHAAAAKPFPYTKTYDQAEWDPAIVLHTSGSTGLPKPIVVRQGTFGIIDECQMYEDFQDTQYWARYWTTGGLLFVPMPFFHAAGLYCLAVAASFGTEVAFPLPDQPLSADLIMRCLTHSRAKNVVLPPSICEELSYTEEGTRTLAKLDLVSFGGGNLSLAAGAALTKNGVNLNNCMGSTELFPWAFYYQPDMRVWEYFIFNDKLGGIVWKEHDAENRIYEMIIARSDLKSRISQSVFYIFPELTEWSTGDLFQAHPTKPSHWKYYGRADNIIVFSNGEKLNPVTIEDSLVGHENIKGALVAGQDRFQPALILEPTEAATPKNSDEAKALIDEVWPLIEQLNKVTVQHGRISREMVAVSDPNVPFLRAGKGTIQRGLTIKAYKNQIDDIFERAGSVDVGRIKAFDLTSTETLQRSIMNLLADELKVKDIKVDTEFFSIGIDSLQVMNLVKYMQAGLVAAGAAVDKTALTPRAVYANPSVAQLATYLHSVIHSEVHDRADEENKEVTAMQEMAAKYTENLPVAKEGKMNPNDQDQVILLTGTTGSLGAYMLDVLCKSTSVKTVIALNRGPDGGKSRQEPASASRGLGTDFSTVEFVSADLSLPHLGLEASKYEDLLKRADRIIHNAWPVNFNISVSSFEPYVRGVRHLVDFSAAASKRVPIIFISTIGTVNKWSSSEAVPESPLTDVTLPVMGYGRSKAASSAILDAASAQSGVPTASVRVGQIAGPRSSTRGKWNPQEFLPSLIASSVYLGVLPDSLGAADVIDWLTIEDVASLILDIAGATESKDVSQISGYFHAVNPKTTTWADLADSVKEYYGGRIKRLVSLEEWVDALDKSSSNMVDVGKNPAIKLLDTYQGFLEAKRGGQKHVRLAMDRTVKHSSTAARLEAVTPEMMRTWCDQWQF